MSESEPGNDTWHRKPGAVFAAGGLTVAVLATLVVTVVQKSDEWSKPVTPVLTTLPSPTAPTTSRSQAPLIITPDTSSSTFTTSVPLSTTDIGLPGPAESTPTTSESGESETPSRSSRTTESDSGDQTATTTRKRPRLNETRTARPVP